MASERIGVGFCTCSSNHMDEHAVERARFQGRDSALPTRRGRAGAGTNPRLCRAASI